MRKRRDPEQPVNLGGRPPKPESERLVQRSVRMPPDLWEKVDAHGGVTWIRELIRRARPKGG